MGINEREKAKDPEVERLAIALYAIAVAADKEPVTSASARRWWKEARPDARASCRRRAEYLRQLLGELATSRRDLSVARAPANR